MPETELTLTRTPLDIHGGPPDAWETLYRSMPRPSIFLSPPWIRTWLQSYGRPFKGEWLIWSLAGQPAAATLFLRRPAKFGPFPIELGVINTSAEDGNDGAYVEYNDVLFLPDHRAAVIDSVAKTLREQRWDQLLFAGYAEDSVLPAVIERLGPCRATSKAKPSPFVDLVQLRSKGDKAAFSSNTRSQIRRAIKMYEERGPVTLAAATSVGEAQSFLAGLVRLHQASWTKRGLAGAFSSDRFNAFHRELVAALWPTRHVDLLQVTAGRHEIGYLYNYTADGKIYFYQSGLASEDDNRLKPGLVAHYLAIHHYIKAGAVEYDFMAGDSRYKRSLATGERQMKWTTVDRHSTKMSILRALSDFRKHFISKE